MATSNVTSSTSQTQSTSHTRSHALAVSSCIVYVDDAEAALGFYRDVLGLAVHTDVRNGEFRWLSFVTETQPELEIVVHQIGNGGLPATKDDVRAQADLLAKGLMSCLIFDCGDVDALFDDLQAKGAEVLQEPADQFYGVRDCAFRDPAGNMLRFQRDLTGA